MTKKIIYILFGIVFVIAGGVLYMTPHFPNPPAYCGFLQLLGLLFGIGGCYLIFGKEKS